MPLRQAKTRISLHKEEWSADIDRALRIASKRIRFVRVWSMLSATLFTPVLAAAAWIGLTRFTLLELPQWPTLFFLGGWAVLLLSWALRHRVTAAQSARYLDRALGLDERVSTYVEYARRARTTGLPSAGRALRRALVSDAATILKQSLTLLPNPFGFALRMRHSLAISAALLALVAAIMLPTPLDAVRAEQQALRQTVAGQLASIAELKAEIVARPQLPDNIKQALLADLQRLEDQLSAPGVDRETMLASIADAQEKIRGVSDLSTAQFESLIVAGQIVQARASAVENFRAGDTSNDIENVDEVLSESLFPADLGLAADAAEFLAGFVPLLTNQQRIQTAISLERAAERAGSRDPKLTAKLVEGANALRAGELNPAANALMEVGARFRSAARDQQTAQTIESALSKLDEGRKSIAQAGQSEAKRGQVGFRRREVGSRPGGSQGNNPSDGGQANAGGDAPAPPNQGANIGQNAPALSGPQGGPQGPPGSGNNSSSGGPPNSNSSGGAPPGGPNSDVRGGSAGGGQDSGSKGTLQGPVTGPVGGNSGAISRVQNPAGRGEGGGSSQPDQSGGEAPEQVYVPITGQGPAVNNGGSIAGQAAPESPSRQGLDGRVGGGGGAGGEAEQGRAGPGALTTLHTPYTEVIGEYAQQASEALERAYIPPDAKEYVKEYFTQLGNDK